MSRSGFALSLLASVALAATSRAQIQVSTPISTFDADPQGVPDNPFGALLTPDGTRLVVPISGDSDVSPGHPLNNHRADVFDVDTYAKVGELQTGLYPEDVAATTDGAGALRNVLVTNSTDATLSIFDAALTPAAIATVALPAFTFPFGVTVSPDQSRAYVSTQGGGGEIFVVDVDPASPTFATLVDTIHVPFFGGGVGLGRMAFFGPNVLVVPRGDFTADFSGSTAGVTFLNPSDPNDLTTLVLTPPGADFRFANAVCLTSQGQGFVTVYGYNRNLFVIDVVGRTLVRTVNLGPLAENLQYAVRTSRDERFLIVTNFVNDTLSIFDLENGLKVGDFPVGAEPSEVVFVGDGSKAFVTNHNSNSVSVVEGFPVGSLVLSGPTTPHLGSSLSLLLDGARRDRRAAVLYSEVGNDPSTFHGVSLGLSSPVRVLQAGVADRAGQYRPRNYAIGASPSLVGTAVYFQGATADVGGGVRTSNGLTVVVQP
jgi:DNA-binding beta-propeller fold protein YncE